MRIGIIAEGAEDQAVITNILRAFKIDGSDIEYIKPSLSKDQTDLHNPDNPTIGTFQGVKNACLGSNGYRPYFERFFMDEDNQFMTIHLDTTEIEKHDFRLKRPQKTDNLDYSITLRYLVIEEINNWLEGNYADKLLYAIAIEEIEAWCLTIYEKKDSTLSANPKDKLQRFLNQKGIKIEGNNKAKSFENIVSNDFRSKKKLISFLEYNQSLKDFYNSLQKVFT